MEEICYLIARNSGDKFKVAKTNFHYERDAIKEGKQMLYTVFKIACYAELNSNFRIKKAIFEFKYDNYGINNLINCNLFK